MTSHRSPIGVHRYPICPGIENPTPWAVLGDGGPQPVAALGQRLKGRRRGMHASVVLERTTGTVAVTGREEGSTDAKEPPSE